MTTNPDDDEQLGDALDWLLNWASAQDSRVPKLYFRICDGEITADEASAEL